MGNGGIHRIDVVTIHITDHVPAIGFKTFGCVVDEPRSHLAVDADAVVVVQRNQFVQLPRASQSAGLVADAFHQAAIAEENIGVVVYHCMAGAVELLGQ